MHETGELKNRLRNLNFQSYVFDDVRNKLVSIHCNVRSNVLTVTDENRKRCIFTILPVNVLRSYLNYQGLSSFRKKILPIIQPQKQPIQFRLFEIKCWTTYWCNKLQVYQSNMEELKLCSGSSIYVTYSTIKTSCTFSTWETFIQDKREVK